MGITSAEQKERRSLTVDWYSEAIKRGVEIMKLRQIIEGWKHQLPENFTDKAMKIFDQYDRRNEENTARRKRNG